jgi:alkylated DNA repair protein (DNA oxidative demethylase)
MTMELASGVVLWPGRLAPQQQAALVAEIVSRTALAPFFRPVMPGSGKPFSVAMTNFGSLGWLSDQAKGYRYEAYHPTTRAPWPAIPEALLDLWAATTRYLAAPEACLVNLYRAGARMGLHRDEDEAATDAPVLSVSLGDTAIFRFGSTERRGPTRTVKLASGDVLMFGGPARLMYHGIDRILAGGSSLIEGGGRINLTLRRVTDSLKRQGTQSGG